MDSGVNPGVNPGTDVYLAKQIEGAIADDERTVELGVTVDVRAGRVFLRGKVSTVQRKDAVTGVAREHAPEHEIVNEIHVEDPAAGAPPATAEERIR
jgi:osmotically-inducible protein OsmY